MKAAVTLFLGFFLSLQGGAPLRGFHSFLVPAYHAGSDWEEVERRQSRHASLPGQTCQKLAARGAHPRPDEPGCLQFMPPGFSLPFASKGDVRGLQTTLAFLPKPSYFKSQDRIGRTLVHYSLFENLFRNRWLI